MLSDYQSRSITYPPYLPSQRRIPHPRMDNIAHDLNFLAQRHRPQVRAVQCAGHAGECPEAFAGEGHERGGGEVVHKGCGCAAMQVAGAVAEVLGDFEAPDYAGSGGGGV
jgi:hypothetical protein